MAWAEGLNGVSQLSEVLRGCVVAGPGGHDEKNPGDEVVKPWPGLGLVGVPGGGRRKAG